MPTLPKPILPPAIQAQLGLRDPRFRPLSTVQTVLRDLGEFDIDAQQIRDLAEFRLLVAFNIATHLNSKPELRILTKSIAHFRDTAGRKYHELEWPDLMRLILPPRLQRSTLNPQPSTNFITGLEIRRALLCDRGHVENLILARHLVPLQRSKCGPGGTWTVSLSSYETFLKARLL